MGCKAGLLELLASFEAYGADPVRKKAFYFLAVMQNTGLWTYKDPENLGAPVDYHEVRGHLRYGTVKIVDESLKNKILAQEEVTQQEDVQIRNAVFQAIATISQLTGKDANQLHYFFWNMFRNCCRRDETHCEVCTQHPSLPERYAQIKGERCVFADGCASANKSTKLIDHIVKSSYH